ncbi:MAG: S-adenosylmethionine:tRNA ribosyltransferase-isomerase [bacterium]|nr:S-adenosylmethionine:tRNA ribosyltransferase-isomerase [bacterium]
MLDPDLLLSNYDYYLPQEAIAQMPSIPAHSAKLMICSPAQTPISVQHQHFRDLQTHLDSRYLLFLNRSKVFKARIPLNQTKIIRKSGKKIWLPKGEIFVYSLRGDQQFECLVSDSKNFRPGTRIFLSDEVWFESLSFTENGLLFTLHGAEILPLLEQYGEMPLPPYINYSKDKEVWYQTFFAQEIGSAAAPTASLHFSPELILALEHQGVDFEYLCLHVGLGTFKPVFEPIISDQQLHSEPMLIPHQLRTRIAEAKQEGKIFLPIGTTMIRFLESLPYIWQFLKKKKLTPPLPDSTLVWRDQLSQHISQEHLASFIPEQTPSIVNTLLKIDTRLFLRPGISFLLTDELISNFHLPKSSLLMLIAAFMGRKNLLNCYQEAIEKGYRFYSFGDGMWIKKPSQSDF